MTRRCTRWWCTAAPTCSPDRPAPHPALGQRRRTDEEKQADWEQAQEPVFRPDTRGGDFSDTADYIRRYYDEHPAA
jgi:hypothetical protein